MLARSLLSNSHAEEVKIFYSYSRKDSSFRSVIDNILGKFKWDVDVRTWYDGDIQPGEDWASEIDHNLNTADMVLLFITQKYIDSDYCMRVELPQALENYSNRNCRVIPVIVEETTPNWQTLPFAKLQVLPQNGQALSQWPDKDEAIRNIVQGIVDIIAIANIDPNGRCRWQLHLEAEKADFTFDDELRLVQQLRELSLDDTLRPRAIGDGSVVALFDSTHEGLRRIKRCFAEMVSMEIAGYTVKRIVELYGAGLQARISSTQTASSSQSAREPDPSLLLFPSANFHPPVLASMVVRDGASPSNMNFIITRGDDKLEGDSFEKESEKLISFFLTTLNAPDDDIFVNLAPDESNRMLGPHLEGTQLGHAMLEEDYRLKRLSASLLHPDTDSGRAFWRQVFKEARVRRIKPNTVFSTFQRVWIVPDVASVYVGEIDKNNPILRDDETQISVSESYLRVVCEHQHIADYSSVTPVDTRWTGDAYSEIFTDLIVPIIEKEVNNGRHFSGLRQIYHSMTLAAWCKKAYRSDPAWAQWFNPENRMSPSISSITPYIIGRKNVDTASDSELVSSPTLNEDNANNRNRTPSGLSAEQAKAVQRIRDSNAYDVPENREYFERYLSIFREGVFHLVRDEYDPELSVRETRTYFAGAIDFRRIILKVLTRPS